jgi:endonuclease/exonuclease/phosphatase family metal-dependent hydrolase
VGFDAGHGIDDLTLTVLTADGSPVAPPYVGMRIDGQFDDWQRHAATVHHDAVGDGWGTSLDFETIGAAIGPDGLALYLKTVEPFVIATSALQIRIDTDGDELTGERFLGLGVEVRLDFAPLQTDLRFFPAEAIYHTGARLPAGEFISELLPNGLNDVQTHTPSREYELLIPLAVLPNLQPGGRVGVSFRDGSNVRGDVAPNFDTTFHIEVPPYLFVEYDLTDLAKRDPRDLRIGAWNVYHDGPADPAKEDRFGRQLAATRPDVVAFQEMWDSRPAWARSFMAKWVPLPNDAPWFAVHFGDSIIASRFPIKRVWTIQPRNLLAWLDTEQEFGMDVLVISAHTKAFQEFQDQRMRETDTIVDLIRRLRLGLEPNGPQRDFALFAVGDFNANSPKPELTQLRTATLANPSPQSLAFWPDAFGRPLVDAAPRHTHRQRIATWQSFTTSSSQRLDYIFYPETQVTKQRSFTVETATMPAAFLTEHGLQALDARVSDHLLMIADFRPRVVNYAWEAVDHIHNGSFYSRWFGHLQVMHMPFVWSEFHGILYPLPGEHGVWLWDPHLGWWFSGSHLYPFAWVRDRASWVYFDRSAADERRFYDFGTQSWQQGTR